MVAVVAIVVVVVVVVVVGPSIIIGHLVYTQTDTRMLDFMNRINNACVTISLYQAVVLIGRTNLGVLQAGEG